MSILDDALDAVPQWPLPERAMFLQTEARAELSKMRGEMSRMKDALIYIAAHGMGSSNDGAVHLGEHAYKALYPAIDDAFCMCGHRDSQHDGEEVCQVNGCMCCCFTEDHSSRPDAVEQAGVADVARPQTIEANPD